MQFTLGFDQSETLDRVHFDAKDETVAKEVSAKLGFLEGLNLETLQPVARFVSALEIDDHKKQAVSKSLADATLINAHAPMINAKPYELLIRSFRL